MATIILGLLAPQAFESITLLLVEMLVVDGLVGLSAFIVLSAIKAHVLAKTADINNSIAFVDSLSSFRTSGDICNFGKYNESIIYSTEALDMDPNNTFALNNKGLALFLI